MQKSGFSKDIVEFLKILFEFKVKYLIVGGRAVIYYGYARLTGDIDIFYEKSEENINKLYNALKKFWGGRVLGIKDKNELKKKNQIIQYGIPPNRIDLMGDITGISFDKCWENRVEIKFSINKKYIKVYYIGLKELVKNKRKMKRAKDKEDLKYLNKLINIKNEK